MMMGGCADGAPPAKPPTSPPVAAAGSAASPAAVPSAQAVRAQPPPVVRYSGFASPECVLYDAQHDRYLVSNISGGHRNADGDGFISALSPDGAVTSLKLIEGGKNGVKLDAPKGMAIADNVLYVSDIRVVRMFDLASGAPKGEIAIAGATYLNDMAAAPDGRIFVSDSGLKTSGKNFDPTGTDSVWILERGHAKALAKTPELHHPNGMAWSGGLVVVASGAPEIYRLDASGAKTDVTTLPAGGLDGVVALGDTLLVSSGDAAAIYKGKLGGQFDLVLSGQLDASDIGYDTKRGRLLVPHMSANVVEVHDLK